MVADDEDCSLLYAGSVHANPLAYDEANCLLYAQGSIELIRRDVELALEGGAAKEAMDKIEGPLESAYSLRLEVVCLKKVVLLLFNEARLVESRLQRLGLFFYVDDDNDREGPWTSAGGEYAEIAAALHSCRGTIYALQETRDVAKWICKLPRHPRAKRPQRLNKLKKNTLSSRLEAQMRRAVFDEHLEKKCESSDGDSDDDVRLGFSRRLETEVLEGWRGPFERRFLLRSVWARGGAKAVSIENQLRRYASALAAEPERLARLAQVSEDRGVELTAQAEAAEHPYALRAKALMCVKHRAILEAAERVMRATRSAVDAILRGERSLFVAGDVRQHGTEPQAAKIFVDDPAVARGFSDELGRVRQVATEFEERMAAIVEEVGWPPPASAGRRRAAVTGGDARCDVCGTENLKAAWVKRGVCWGCERLLRREGRCPFSEICRSRAKKLRARGAELDGFCAHSGRCFVCDSWSCEQCGLTRSDGEELVARASGRLVFLDFDRTLSSTRAGADPLLNSAKKSPPKVDEALASLLASQPSRCAVVTRNSHRDSIRTFLKQNGVPDTLIIRSVKLERTSKAAVIKEIMKKHDSCSSSLQGLFADDDINELFDPDLPPTSKVHRILFARTAA